MKSLAGFNHFFIAMSLLCSLESMGQVAGRVTDTNELPLPQVNISIKGSDRGTQTDPDGKYSIVASRGDTLFFSHLGLHPVELRVRRSSEQINIQMYANTIALEEVEVKAKTWRKTAYKSQKELLAEYTKNKNLIKTSWRIIDKDLSSSYFRIIDGDDLSLAGTDFLVSLAIHVPKMRIIGGPGGIKVFLGIASRKAAIFDVDGIIFESAPIHISAGEIYRVAVLGVNAGSFRYGPAGAGGVIVINTRAQTAIDDMSVDRSEEHKKFLDSLTRVTLFESYQAYEAPYFKKLKKARRGEKALAIFETQKESYLDNPYYFLDVYDYFLSRWGESSKSEELYLDVREHLSDNVHELKALAYLQQRYGFHKSALELYVQILLNQSWEGQALRDVANAYAELGDIKKAWMYYTQYVDIQYQLPGSEFEAFDADQLITTEMMGILDKYDHTFLNNQDMEDNLDEDVRTRLVFEWSQPEAEFDLQFVTPEGYYDTWEHQSGNKSAQDPEIAKGYCSKQFFLGQENIGLWQVNMDYRGNGSGKPMYLKVSIYEDFGLASQQQKVKVYMFSEGHGRVQLFTFSQD